MSGYYDYKCTNPNCGKIESRYCNARKCRKCGWPINRLLNTEEVLDLFFSKCAEIVYSVTNCVAEMIPKMIETTTGALQIIVGYRIKYQECGAPFGDTEEGFKKWLEERASTLKKGADNGQ